MNKPWLVTCLDCRYDEESEMLVLVCLFHELNQKRIVCFSKSDFHATVVQTVEGIEKKVIVPCPHVEMYKTAAMFVGKPFSILIEDDPNRLKEADTTGPGYSKIVSEFKKSISDELEKVANGLNDENKTIARRLGDIVAEEKNKTQETADQILAKEFAIRAKLNQIGD